MKFSISDIRRLAEMERDFDSGKQPYVVNSVGRVAVSKECMDDLGLEQGQTITHIIMIAIAEWNVANCKTKIAIKKAQEN